jgi:hypothetical protein
MTIVQAPCSSIEAHGTIAKSLTYAKVRRTAYTKAHFTPSNPQSDAQTATRMMRQWLIETWATLTAAEKAAWAALAENYRLSPYHAFLKINCRRWASDILPQKTPVVGPPCKWTQYYSTFRPLAGVWRITAYLYGETEKPFALQLLTSPYSGFTPARTDTTTFSTTWTWYESYWCAAFNWTPPYIGSWYAQTRYCMPNGSTSRYFPPGTFYP